MERNIPPYGRTPKHWLICEDESQWANHQGKQWTSSNVLATKHANHFLELELNLFEIKTFPHFAIGQRALLIQSKYGNILWDCLSLSDALADGRRIRILTIVDDLHGNV